MKRMTLIPYILLLAGCYPSAEQSDEPGNSVINSTSDASGMIHNKVAMTGDPDRDFATMMIDHHRGAIRMAKEQLAKGKDAEMRALAEKVIADQQREIGQMEAYLARPTR